ncbi:MFS transporter [Tenggerimyces flavus]|uniref:MFS transporter n=1 Tax=Tenggerimyces flavus TaxID=1708749 RepID=A0ABV7Y4S9_9ACTN|nr:MFS transporter [Tenggerimyces flavus]MBM7788338.1 DHA2 family multidrug resistance protein-like MFS transporter [Tenggerimyces flavus]
MTGTAMPQRAGRREWIGLAVLVLPTVLISVDMSVLYLAVPKLSADLQPTSVELLWITDIYGFLIAGSLITMGTIGDRIGRRKLLLIGAAAFGLASVLAAYAPTPELLIAARALLGIAGATLMPSTMSLIRNMFHDDRQRTVALSLWMTGFSVGTVIGPLVGGLLLEHFWWGSVFLAGVPVMALLVVLGPFLVPEFKTLTNGRIDLLSTAMSLGAILGVIYGLKQIAADGLSLEAAAAIVAGAGLALAFVRRQRRLEHPLLDLDMFKMREFTAALVTMMLVMLVGPGTAFLVSQYLQLVAGLSPLEAGFWSLIPAVAIVLGFVAAPILFRWLPRVYVAAGGLAIGALALLLLTQTDQTSGPLVPTLAHTLFFLGASPLIVVGMDLVVGSAPVERSGAASAISETGSELSAALGIAAFGSIATAVYVSGLPADASAAVRETLAAATGPELEQAREAFVGSLHVVGIVAAVVVATAAVLTAVLLERDNAREPELEVVES